MAKQPISAVPEMTPSNMFFGLSRVLPGKVCTATFPPVFFSTSVFHLSIWTQGKVGAGGKLAYLSVIVWAPEWEGTRKLAPKTKVKATAK
jgi:hypothetical protein